MLRGLLLLYLYIALGFALPTDQVSLQPGSRVAIMTGTYSPPHRRHDEIFEQLLASGLVDYVLVIPNDVTPHKPFALESDKRLKMLEAAYKDHPNILYPHSLEIGFPLSSKTRAYLNSKNTEINWVGVMGKDAALTRLARFGASLQSVSEWIVSTADEGDDADIPKKIGSKKVTRLYAPTNNDVHSKEIRKAASEGDMAELERLLLPSVAAYVAQEGLYRNADPKAKLGDYVRSCKNIILKYIGI